MPSFMQTCQNCWYSRSEDVHSGGHIIERVK